MTTVPALETNISGAGDDLTDEFLGTAQLDRYAALAACVIRC
ncbi:MULTISPECIES: hypothetical protein [unclassified Synechococcus]|nr:MULTISPECIES: hypothetical protein [unclassified Synechococcus]